MTEPIKDMTQEGKEKKNSRRKNDIIIIALLALLGLIGGFGFRIWQENTTENPVAVVTVDGEEYGRFPLDTDCEERIELSDGSYNIFVIKDGVADMTEASCLDKICGNHRDISKKNESITCLPNKVIITIENGENPDIDAITN